MTRGEFRDEQPTDPKEVAMRNAAIMAIERLCESLGEPVPLLDEHETNEGTTRRCTFIGELPDGRRLGIGYELFEPFDLEALKAQLSDHQVPIVPHP